MDTHTSKVLFENQHYIACITSAGLSVQSKSKGNGKLLPTNTKSFEEWLWSFENSVSKSESNALCRAIYNCAA